MIITRSCLRQKRIRSGKARHRTVVVENLADHSRRIQSCKTRQIDRRLGLTPPLQHAAIARPKRENMSRSAEVVRMATRIEQQPESFAPDRELRCPL